MVEGFSILQNNHHVENYHTAGDGIVQLAESDLDREVQEKDQAASPLSAADSEMEATRSKRMSSKVKDWDRKMDASEGSVTVTALVKVVGTAEKWSDSDDPVAVAVVLVEHRNWGSKKSWNSTVGAGHGKGLELEDKQTDYCSDPSDLHRTEAEAAVGIRTHTDRNCSST